MAEFPSRSEHERRLRQLPCMVSCRHPVTLHHCHGGSIKDAGWHVGMGQKQNPYLQIPLHAEFHVGAHGIDYGVGVQSWEATFGDQHSMLLAVSEALGYDVFEAARTWEEEHRGKSAQVQCQPHNDG